MIGFRGASRYMHPAYQPAFELECQAIRRVRDTMGLTNVIVMIPFCRGSRRPIRCSTSWPGKTSIAARTGCKFTS